MRRFAVLTGILLAVALVGGCGAGGRPQTFAWFGKPATTPTRSPEDNPFRRELADRQRENATAVANAAERRENEASFPSHPAARGLDAATQALIDRELHDATPEERRELLAEFENIEPTMIRQLLRIRRMVRQVGHHASAGEPPAGADAHAGPSLAGFEALAAGEQLRRAAPAVGHSRGGPPPPVSPAGGLGEVDPWSQAPHTGRYAPPSVQLLAAEPDATPVRPAPSAWARMVPRLDGLPNLFPGTPAAVAGALATGEPPSAAASDPPVVPSAVPAEAVWQRDLESLIARLEADAAHMTPPSDPYDPAAENYVAAHVYLRLLYLIAGRQEQAIAHIPGVDPVVQQFWQQLLWSMANYFDFENMPDPAERATQTLLQLHAAATHLQEQARLKLGNVAFCTKISSFGNYDRFDPYEFSPGQPVLLYAEVENFRSEPTTDQHGQNAFRTVLKSKIDILSPSGEIRYQMEFPPTEDLCRAYRRDYFHSYEFTVPPRIPYGHHVLVLTVEDRVSQKLATYRLNFTVK